MSPTRITVQLFYLRIKIVKVQKKKKTLLPYKIAPNNGTNHCAEDIICRKWGCNPGGNWASEDRCVGPRAPVS